MKIVALSDMVLPNIYSPAVRTDHGDAEMVIGCGDLPYYYLEYVTSMLPVPVAFVYGNHDSTQHMSDGRRVNAPEGCMSLEGRSIEINGLLIAGLGGSMRYKPHAEHQYSEGEMRSRILKLAPQLMSNKIKYGRYLDILVTHSPPYGIHDEDDLPHTGFKSFLQFMKAFKPRYLLHGHKHIYRQDTIRETQYEETMVVNVYPLRVLEWNENNEQFNNGQRGDTPGISKGPS